MAKRRRTLFVSVVLALGVLSPTVTFGDESNKEERELKIFEKQTLNFSVVAGSSDGISTIVLSPTGSVTTTGYGILIRNNIQVGKYKIKGPANANVTITLPSSVTLTNGASHATLTQFTSLPATVGTLNSRGKLTIKVGATLNIPASHSGGDYTGPLTIYVDLQNNPTD